MQEVEHLALNLPIVGSVQLPRPEHLAYYGAVGVLVALEVIEWPIAILLTAGHALTSQHHNRAIREFGEVLEDTI